MKAVILYDTKHGTSAEAAAEIAKGLEDGARLAALADARAVGDIVLAECDLIVVGGPIYFGQWSKRALAFISSHEEDFRGKRLALFAVGNLVSEGAETVKAALPAGISAKGLPIGWFGGRMAGQRLSWGERLIVKMVSKAPQPSRNFDPEAARAFGVELSRS